MEYLNANWAAPSHVFAVTSTRQGGVSQSPYVGNNLAHHVGDHRDDVDHNRNRLIHSLSLPNHPTWLEQTHSTDCVIIEEDLNRIADASITRQADTVLAILTADCLPIVITNDEGNEIAAIHAGWRGLANGIIDVTLNKMRSPRDHLMAWIGPAICQKCYQTGTEVQRTFIDRYAFTQPAFSHRDNQIHANLPQLAQMILMDNGVLRVSQSNACTYESIDETTGENQYYSYRRAKQTGRIATLIWFK